MICADQFRADFVGANHENPSVKTPHIDALAATRRELQPDALQISRSARLRAPRSSRAGMRLRLPSGSSDSSSITRCRPSRRSSAATDIRRTSSASGTCLRRTSATARSKWDGFRRDRRAAVSTICGRARTCSNSFRILMRATTGTTTATISASRMNTALISLRIAVCSFIEQKHDKPWLLFLSQLEPHHQNDVDAFVPPKRYEDKLCRSVYPCGSSQSAGQLALAHFGLLRLRAGH